MFFRYVALNVLYYSGYSTNNVGNLISLTEHKVIVAMFDLKAVFEHYSVPKKVANAYLKAKLVNDSPYLILAGPSSVFMDNNFITKVGACHIY